MKLLSKFLPDFFVEKKYIRAGSAFGDAVSYLYIGECRGFEKLLDNWDFYEKEYSRRGYRTVSLDSFVELGGYGKNIADLLRNKRSEDEEAVFHAKIYRDKFLGRVKPVVDIDKMKEEGFQAGTYYLPSTEK